MKKSNLKKLNLKKSMISNVTSARITAGLQTIARPSELVRMCNYE